MIGNQQDALQQMMLQKLAASQGQPPQGAPGVGAPPDPMMAGQQQPTSGDPQLQALLEALASADGGMAPGGSPGMAMPGMTGVPPGADPMAQLLMSVGSGSQPAAMDPRMQQMMAMQGQGGPPGMPPGAPGGQGALMAALMAGGGGR